MALSKEDKAEFLELLDAYQQKMLPALYRAAALQGFLAAGRSVDESVALANTAADAMIAAENKC